MQERGDFSESVCQFKHKYGTPKCKVQEQLEKGIDVILEIETKGATKIREQFPEAIFIFITPSSYDELARRLRNRGTEEEEMVKMRLKIARTEYRSIGQYDYIAINDDLDSCVDTVIAIIKAERARKINYEDLVKKLASLYRTHKNEE